MPHDNDNDNNNNNNCSGYLWPTARQMMQRT